MSQVENKNGDKTWIHCTHIHHFAPLPTHLSNTTPPLHCVTLFKIPMIILLHALLEHITQHKLPDQNPKQKKTNADKANTRENSHTFAS